MEFLMKGTFLGFGIDLTPLNDYLESRFNQLETKMTQFYEDLKNQLSELSSKQDAISQAITELKTTTEIESKQIQNKLSEFGLTDEQKAEILTMVGNIADKADSAHVAVNEAEDAISNLVTETSSEPVAPPEPVPEPVAFPEPVAPKLG